MNPDPLRVQPKKLFEPANREELLRGRLLHAHKGRDGHGLAARRNDTYRYWLGVPTIILSGVSSGVGQSTARLLSRKGYKVFGTSSNPTSILTNRKDMS